MFLMLDHVYLMSFLDSLNCLVRYWRFASRVTLFNVFLYYLYWLSIL